MRSSGAALTPSIAKGQQSMRGGGASATWGSRGGVSDDLGGSGRSEGGRGFSGGHGAVGRVRNSLGVGGIGNGAPWATATGDSVTGGWMWDGTDEVVIQEGPLTGMVLRPQVKSPAARVIVEEEILEDELNEPSFHVIELSGPPLPGCHGSPSTQTQPRQKRTAVASGLKQQQQQQQQQQPLFAKSPSTPSSIRESQPVFAASARAGEADGWLPSRPATQHRSAAGGGVHRDTEVQTESLSEVDESRGLRRSVAWHKRRLFRRVMKIWKEAVSIARVLQMKNSGAINHSR